MSALTLARMWISRPYRGHKFARCSAVVPRGAHPWEYRGAMPLDTGFPTSDAQNDFTRARRHQALASLAQRLRREPSDVNMILPFDEVVEALGRTGERALGLQSIPLDSIVGSVGRTREFDRSFRPTS